MQLGQKTVGCHFEEFSGFLEVFLEIFAEISEQVRTFLNKTRHLVHYVLYYRKSVAFLPYRVEFYLPDLPDYELV